MAGWREVAVVVMGVSGCGKSSLGQAVAGAIGGRFVEADALHSAGSVAKMAAGIALDDADRWPWLARVGSALAGTGTGTEPVVAACSALKRSYRDVLRAQAGRPVHFVFVDLDRATLEQRMRDRRGHYMPASLLDSQLATLERLSPDEDGIVLVGDMTLEQQVAEVVATLKRRGLPAA